MLTNSCLANLRLLMIGLMVGLQTMPRVPLPRFQGIDLLVGGQFEPWDNWVWWTWQYRSGCREWIPAYKFLLSNVDTGTFDQAELANYTEHLLVSLHVHFQLPPIPCVHLYKIEQLCYNRELKSQWWFESLPAYSHQLANPNDVDPT